MAPLSYYSQIFHIYLSCFLVGNICPICESSRCSGLVNRDFSRWVALVGRLSGLSLTIRGLRIIRNKGHVSRNNRYSRVILNAVFLSSPEKNSLT